MINCFQTLLPTATCATTARVLTRKLPALYTRLKALRASRVLLAAGTGWHAAARAHRRAISRQALTRVRFFRRLNLRVSLGMRWIRGFSDKTGHNSDTTGHNGDKTTQVELKVGHV